MRAPAVAKHSLPSARQHSAYLVHSNAGAVSAKQLAPYFLLNALGRCSACVANLKEVLWAISAAISCRTTFLGLWGRRQRAP
eukprot:555682-Pyramimonas_sp.AAC.1